MTLAANSILVPSAREREQKQDVFAVVSAVILKIRGGLMGTSLPYFIMHEPEAKI